MQWSLFFIHGGLCETLWVINVFIATPMDSLSISGPLNVPKWHKRVSEPERIPEESRENPKSPSVPSISSFKRLKTWNSFSDNKKKASGYRFITGPRIFKNISRIPTRLRIWDNPDSSSCQIQVATKSLSGITKISKNLKKMSRNGTWIVYFYSVQLDFKPGIHFWSMKNSNPDSRSCQIQMAIKSWAGITNNLLKKSQKNV